MDIKKYCIYVRCSTEEQLVEGYSIQTQVSKCLKFINSFENAVHVKTYSDEGISATDPLEKRKGLMKLLLDAQDRTFDCVVVMASDRLIRMSEHDQHIFYVLMKYDIEVITCNNEILTDNSPMGQFMRKLRIAISELEVKLLSFRVKSTMQLKAENGEWKGGSPTYGFEWDKEEKNMNPINEKIDQIKMIFSMYTEEKKGVSTIRDFLNNSNNLYIIDGKFELWNRERIYSILSNPVYSGYHYHNKRFSKFEIKNGKKYKDKNEWEIYPIDYIAPIISKETWEKTQEIRELRAKKILTVNTSKTTWLLTGIVYCGVCGNALQGHPIINKYKTKKGQIKEYDCSNYICTGKINKGKNFCNARQVVKKEIEKTIFDTTYKYIEHIIEEFSNITDEHIKQVINKTQTKNYDEQTKLDQEKKHIQKKIDKYYLDYENDKITAEILSPAINRLNIELNLINEKLKVYKEQKNIDKKIINSIEEYKKQLKEWRNYFDNPDGSDILRKKLMLINIINYVEVININGNIYYNFDFKPSPINM